MDDLRTSVLPAVLRRKRSIEETFDRAFERGLTRVLAAERAAGWEWAVAIAAIFFFGRSNVLFFRQRLAAVFGGPAGVLWQDDVVLQVVFGAISAVVFVVAIRRARPSALLRQPLLMSFTALSWISIMWSIEPQISVRRALLFAGTVMVGWYVGDRFRFRDQLRIIVGVAVLGVLGTILALVFWTDLATTTNGNPGQWSGMYVNRNLLGSVLSFGLLAMVFLLRSSKRPWPLRIIAAIFLVLLMLTGNRTGPVALTCALAVAFCVWMLRRHTANTLTAAGGAYVSFATLGTVGLAVHWYWTDILRWLGRDPTLTHRSWIWEVNRWFSHARPWTGWGFEALWTNDRAIEQAYGAIGRYPFSAHNGYYEVLLSVGWPGLALFVAFLGLAVWKAFGYAWRNTDATSLWPLTFIVFAVIVNFSESLFVSSEAIMALTVACVVGVTEWSRRELG